MHNKQLRPAATSVGEGPEMRQAAENDTPEQDLKRQRTVGRGPSGGPAQGGMGMERAWSGHGALVHPRPEDVFTEVPVLTLLAHLSVVCLCPTE